MASKKPLPQAKRTTSATLVQPVRKNQSSLVNMAGSGEKNSGELTNFGNVVNNLRPVTLPKKGNS
jgi:hypothetical protein